MQNLDLVVRRARVSDVESLVDLLKELFSIEEDFEFNEALQTKGLLCLLQEEGGHVLVAECGRRVIGMCTMQVLISTAEGGRVGLIEDMVVSQDFRRKGVGKALLDEMRKISGEKGLRRLQLLADSQNELALKFYNKTGWFKTQLICFRKKILTSIRDIS